MAEQTLYRSLAHLHLAAGALFVLLVVIAEPLWRGLGEPAQWLMAVSAALFLLSASGLIGHRSWAKPVALIASAVGLANIPLGTALGIYTIERFRRVPQESVENL